VRIGWSRSDVPVMVDGAPLPPAAGLGTWAAFKSTGNGKAIVMGDTVVFQDEVGPAMDAAFANGLSVTALHNHFFYAKPMVYFMHIGGEGPPDRLAASVKAVWDAIKAVRAAHPRPAEGFGGPRPQSGKLNAGAIGRITGLPASRHGTVVKVSVGRAGHLNAASIGASMGLTSWAAFSGSDPAASIDGDFIMTAPEVQPVLKALRRAGLHIVALHNHMIDTSPMFYFTHFWGTGDAASLARGFRAALDAQSAVGETTDPDSH